MSKKDPNLVFSRERWRYLALRQKIGTQSFVAKILGVSLRTVQRREKGEIAISNEAMIALFELVRSPRYEVLRRIGGRESEAAGPLATTPQALAQSN